MIDPRRQRFAPYIRRLADLLALRDWTLDVDDDGPADPGADATITITYGRKNALIRLSDPMLGLSPEKQRQAVVHELVHCHLEPAWAVAHEALAENLQGVFRRLSEYSVDGLADGIAPLLPLPDEE